MTLVIVWYGRYRTPIPWFLGSTSQPVGARKSKPIVGCNDINVVGAFQPTQPEVVQWMFITNPQPGARFELIASYWKHLSNGSESPS